MEDELKAAKTMKQILNICIKYYNLDENLGIATKSAVTMGVKHAIKLIKAKPKNDF